MIKYGPYLIIENKKDLKRVENINNNKNKKFPQFYRYYDSPDPHFCGEYWPCKKKEIIKFLKKKKEELENDIAVINSL